MKNKGKITDKKAVSLIVLVITIIVIIILATAVILTVNNNNPISSAKKSVIASDIANIQDAYTAYITSKIPTSMAIITGNGIITSDIITSSVEKEAKYQEEQLGLANVVNASVGNIGIDSSKIASVAIKDNVIVGVEELDGNKSRYFKKENQQEITKEEYLALAGKVTADIPNIEGKIEITTLPSEWTKGNVTVTFTYAGDIPEGYYIRYKVGNSEWKKYTTSFDVEENTTIVVNMYSEKLDNEQLTNSKTISNIDKTAPTAPTSVTVTNGNNKVMALATGSTDVGSGILKYQYSKDNSSWQDSGEFTGIKSGTEVTIYARAVDKVGNVSKTTSNKGTTNTVSGNVTITPSTTS